MRQKQILVPSIIASALLIIAIFPIKEYSYFIFLRWVVCFTAIYVGYFLFQAKRHNWVWRMGIMAILFNPIKPFHFDKGYWQMIDLITAIIFVTVIFVFKKIDKEKTEGTS